ncbi:MAG: DNA primase [Nitrospirae bacterium]|nr:MAG: DNA primase [Nitrospirota bacterium]
MRSITLAAGRRGVPPAFLQQLRDAIDIVTLISGYVALSKIGQNYRGLCPFHSEKTPSFTVTPSRQMFYCFGCGTGGDVFTFLMKKEGIGFMEAVRELAELAKLPVPSEAKAGSCSTSPDQRVQLEAIHARAQTWFHHNLFEHAMGRTALAYLTERGLHLETLRAFGVGFAPASWDGLTRYLLHAGFRLQDVVQSGLILTKPGKTGYYDRFRGRIMIPIVNLRGQVVGFGGRVLDGTLPKYLNSPETPLFSKGRMLYGLDRAREAIARLNTAILVEGYFDVMTLHQSGFQHVVAPLGTALTRDHVALIRRFATTVVLVFDGDSAGSHAVLRALDLFVNSGMTVRVAILPEGYDPDTYVRTHGSQALHTLLETQAVPLLDFAIEHSLQRHRHGTLDDRIRQVDDLLRIIMKADNVIMREEYTRSVAERLGIRQELLVQRYPQLLRRGETSASPEKNLVRNRDKQNGKKEDREERDLVALLLRGAFTVDQLHALQEEEFTNPLYRQLVRVILYHIDASGTLVWDAFHAQIAGDDVLGPLVAELTTMDEGYFHAEDVVGYIWDCLRALTRKKIRTALNQAIARLRAAERDGRGDEIQRLNAHINELLIRKADLEKVELLSS